MRATSPARAEIGVDYNGGVSLLVDSAAYVRKNGADSVQNWPKSVVSCRKVAANFWGNRVSTGYRLGIELLVLACLACFENFFFAFRDRISTWTLVAGYGRCRFPVVFVVKTRKICRFECRKCAKQRQLRAFRDRIQSRVPAAPAWAAWRVSQHCGWAARRTAVLRISSCYRQSPERSSLGAGFGRSVRGRSTWFAAWAWWAGSCVMRRVRVQPGCVRVQPCSIARFGDSCRGRRERICGAVVGSGLWIVDSCQWPVASGRWRGIGGDGVSRSNGGSIGDERTRWHHFPVADTRVGDEHARWYYCLVADTPAGDARAR